jgi:hypothetical protein
MTKGQGFLTFQDDAGLRLVDLAQVPPPAVSRISPDNGLAGGGTMVTISGSNLSGVTGVYFGSVPAHIDTLVSATALVATSPRPKATGTVDVTVVTAGGTSAKATGDHFTYVPVPSVSGLTPHSGSAGGGTMVTISGSNLSGVIGVYFGSVPAHIDRLVSATAVVATSPRPKSTGPVDVTVVTAGGTSAKVTGDHFTY